MRCSKCKGRIKGEYLKVGGCVVHEECIPPWLIDEVKTKNKRGKKHGKRRMR